jgi:hypothetical protein
MLYIKTFSSIRLWLAIVILIGGSSLFMFLNDKTHEGCSPMEMSFHTAKETNSCEVRVKETDRYAVLLEYIVGSNTDEAHMAVREAVGAPVFKGDEGKKAWTKQSHPIRVEVSISAIDGNSIDEIATEIIEPEVSILARESIYAELIRRELEPGTYRITVKNLKDAPTLRSINTNILLTRAYEGN